MSSRHTEGEGRVHHPVDELRAMGAARIVEEDPEREPVAPASSQGVGAGELCRCGHYEGEHGDTEPHPCDGRVGDEGCTCLGFRLSTAEPT